LESRRLYQLDALRGIAAVMVLLHHNLAAAGLIKGWFRDAIVASPLSVINFGRPAVLFFFVLSGFVLTRALRGGVATSTLRNYVAWILQRTIRLCVPAAAVAVSGLLYALAYHGTWPGEAWWLANTLWDRPPTVGSVLAQATLVAPDGGYSLDNVLWSLSPEWRISLVLPLIAAMAAFQGRSGAMLLALVAITLGGVFGGMASETLNLGATMAGSVRPTLYFLFPFLIGMALETGDAAGFRAGRWHIVAGCTAVLALGRVGTDYATFLASALLIWLALQPGLIQRVLRRPALVWLGAISFSLYLSHESVLAVLHHELHGRLSPTAICALSIAAALPAAHLFHVVVERPAQRLAHAVGRRQRRLVALVAPLSG
jgi:peptidoglycan/LPS O-acetylase OafA/YrhL